MDSLLWIILFGVFCVLWLFVVAIGVILARMFMAKVKRRKQLLEKIKAANAGSPLTEPQTDAAGEPQVAEQKKKRVSIVAVMIGAAVAMMSSYVGSYLVLFVPRGSIYGNDAMEFTLAAELLYISGIIVLISTVLAILFTCLWHKSVRTNSPKQTKRTFVMQLFLSMLMFALLNVIGMIMFTIVNGSELAAQQIPDSFIDFVDDELGLSIFVAILQRYHNSTIFLAITAAVAMVTLVLLMILVRDKNKSTKEATDSSEIGKSKPMGLFAKSLWFALAMASIVSLSTVPLSYILMPMFLSEASSALLPFLLLMTTVALAAISFAILWRNDSIENDPPVGAGLATLPTGEFAVISAGVKKRSLLSRLFGQGKKNNEAAEKPIVAARALATFGAGAFCAFLVLGILAVNGALKFDGQVWVMVALNVLFATLSTIANFLYREYGRKNGFDKFCYIASWVLYALTIFEVIVIIIIIVFILMAFMMFMGGADSSSPQQQGGARRTAGAGEKDLGKGYIERKGVTDYLVIDGKHIQLQDYNYHTGQARDYNGNQYKIG